MNTATITLKQRNKTNKVLLEINAYQFEKLAATFGFFNQDFLDSIDRAEDDYRAGRIKKIKSFKELRKK